VPSRYESDWDRVVSGSRTDDIESSTGYRKSEIVQAHVEIFLSLPDMENTPGYERYRLWREYLGAMVEGSIPRERFYDAVGIDERDFDWQEWREAMGYGRNE
jgi:hypothetical protein